MKNTNKKGFTIVELVIVIAVIAILAAVLIPTFVGLVNKANLSADQQAVRQMNQAIAMTGKEITDINTLIDTLDEQGYNSKKTLVPVSKGHTFYWDSTTNKIILVDANNAVVFPADATYVAGDEKYHSLEASIVYVDVDATDTKTFVDAVNNGYKDITLNTDIAQSDAIVVQAGSEIVVDLGGKKLETGTRNPYDHQYAFNVYGTVTFTNGTIDARGVEVRGGGKVVIGEGVTINAVDDNGGAAVYLYAGAEVEINGGTFKSLAAQSNINGGSVILNNGGKITINDGTFVSEVNGPYVVNHQGGETIINGGTFEAARGVVGAQVSGTVTINGGTFTKTDLTISSSYEVYCDGNATVVINGGTFTNEIFNGPVTDNR